MSCGNPHEVDCSTVLERLHEVLDNEADESTCAMVLKHLQECPPCNQDYGLERSMKALVARACGCEPVPEDLRRRVSLTIQQVQVQVQSGTLTTSYQIETAQWSAGGPVDASD